MMMLFLLGLLHAISVSAAPYIVTTYVELSVYTNDGYTYADTTVPASVYTYTNRVTPTAADFTPISTITESAYYAGVTIVDVVLPTGVGERVSAADYYGTEAYTNYVVPITYTPYASCVSDYSQNWTFSTNVPIYIPTIVSVPVVTVSTIVSSITYASLLAPIPTTSIFAIVNPTDVDPTALATAYSNYEPSGMSYCYTPTSYCPTASSATCTPTFAYDSSSSSSGSNYYGSSSSYYDDGDYHKTWLLIVILVPVGWLLLFFLLGLLESFLSFKGLMLGQKRKRGLPYAWCCVNFITLCWVGPTYQAKTPEEQALLAEKWKELGAGKKFKLWMKWGFRWKYPVEFCGEEPAIAKRPFRQGCL